jgi:1,4-alpha-glucan branching enzyme
MTVGTARQYSEKRTRDHMGRFLDLFHRIQDNRMDEGFLTNLESIDNIFPTIDYRAYQSAH